MKKEMICIVCPVGCHLTIEGEKENLKVSGNRCKRGEVYALQEIQNPTRVLTTTVKLEGASVARLPVKTNGAIPKGKIFDAISEKKKISVKPPIVIGEIIIENIADTGIDLVATREIS